MLWIVADGTKLPPMLIFKSEPNEKIAKELERHPLVESKQVFAYWHIKAWNNAYIMKKWANAVWRRNVHLTLKRRICSLWIMHLCIRYQRLIEV